MASQRPSSPTSLLWAHQLRREHQHLLQRMQGLEYSHDEHDNRIKGAEVAAKSIASEEVASLASKVEVLEDSGLEQRLTKIEKNVVGKMDDVQAESGARTIRIADLEDRERKTREQAELALRGVDDAREGLKKYESGLKTLGKKVESMPFEMVEERLSVVEANVKGYEASMDELRGDVEKLREVNDYLKRKNEGLERQIERAVRGVEEGRAQKRRKISTDDRDVQVRSTPDAEESARKKKSHKWGGGGADRDIIAQGAVLSSRTAAKAKSSTIPSSASRRSDGTYPKKAGSTAKKTAPSAKNAKSLVPNTSSSPTRSPRRPAHRWTGGGAKKDMIASGKSSNLGRRSSRSSDTLGRQPVARKPRESTEGREIVRSGKGWVEYVDDSQEDEDREDEIEAPPVARGRGRPRKEPPSAAAEQTQAKSIQAKRRALFPSLRAEEAELLECEPQTRQTRKQRQTQDVRVKLEESDTTSTRVVISRAQGVFISPKNGGPVTVERLPPGKQPRRKIVQSDSE